MHQYAGFSVILAARFIVIMFRINLALRLCLSSSRGRWIWVESFVGKGKGTLGTGRGRCATIVSERRGLPTLRQLPKQRSGSVTVSVSGSVTGSVKLCRENAGSVRIH